jgi:hypothetical protein
MDAYELRRSGWDANSFQNNSRCLSVDAQGQCHGAPKEGHWLDQYGVQADGPVYLPKLYDGRKRTFFLVTSGIAGARCSLILGVPGPECAGRFPDWTPRLRRHHLRSTGRQEGTGRTQLTLSRPISPTRLP